MRNRVAAVLAAFFMSACSGQQYAGMTHAEITMVCDGKPATITFDNGKEYDRIHGAAKACGWEVEWKAERVRAFDAIEAQAEVRKAIAEEVGDLAPSIAEKAIKALKPMIGLP